MMILARILCFVGIVVLAYVIFFSKPREIIVTEPHVQPQVQVAPQPPRPKSRPKPQPQPADSVTFENREPGQPIFRSLQSQPKPAQTQRVAKAPTVYEWEAPYKAAMVETDRTKRQERIDAAQIAINRRIEEMKLNAGDGSPEEEAEIRNAQVGINILRESSNNRSR